MAEFTKKGLFTVVKKPTKAKVTKVEASAETATPNIYEVEIQEGPLKGRRFGYSYAYDRGFLPISEKGYLFFRGKDAAIKPVALAFDLSIYKMYEEAISNGDTDSSNNLLKLGRVWVVPLGSVGQIIEKDGGIIYVRIEVVSGPMKGKKGWGRIFDIGRKQIAVPTTKK